MDVGGRATQEAKAETKSTKQSSQQRDEPEHGLPRRLMAPRNDK